jgi:hypothetical protein
MPFLCENSGDLIDLLRDIKNNLYNWHTWVVNISFGFDDLSQQSKTNLTNICRELVGNWYMIVVAAVNDHWGMADTVYPAVIDSVIGVSASNRADNGLHGSSCWGDDVELVATGESIFTVDYQMYNDRAVISGTSMAAPFVSSLCALFKCTEAGFFMSRTEMVNKIKQSAKIITAHNKEFYRVDAYAALGIVTGLEDCIIIEGPNLLYENNDYTYTGDFCDFYPYGDFIITPWHWYLVASLYGNKDTLDSGESSGAYNTSWQAYVPNIDEYRNWVRTIDGHVAGYVKAYAFDGEVNHTNMLALGIDVPPLTPANFVGASENNHPKVIWTANTEADLSHYEVWKKKNSGNWSIRTTTTNTSYTDTDELIVAPTDYVYYKVRAFDEADNKSDFTQEIRFSVWGGFSKPIGGGIVQIDNIPDSYQMSQNYPNPFNPSTTIRFGLPDAEKVLLQVFDVNGQLVSTLFDGYLEAGYHSVDFNAQQLSSGIYLYKLTTNSFTSVKRMLLVK